MQYDGGENQQKKLLNCSRVVGANGDIKASREIKLLVSANLNTKKLETQIYINRIFSHCIQNLITPKLEQTLIQVNPYSLNSTPGLLFEQSGILVWLL